MTIAQIQAYIKEKTGQAATNIAADGSLLVDFDHIDQITYDDWQVLAEEHFGQTDKGIVFY